VKKLAGAAAGARAGGRGAGNGALSRLNWPLKFRSKVIVSLLKLRKSILPDVKDKLSIGILIPISNMR